MAVGDVPSSRQPVDQCLVEFSPGWIINTGDTRRRLAKLCIMDQPLKADILSTAVLRIDKQAMVVSLISKSLSIVA